MKCLTPFVVILLIGMTGLAGYNYLEIVRLKSELATIKSTVHTIEAESADSKDLLTELATIKRHTAHAKDLISKGQSKRAKAELDESLQKLETVSKLSQDIAAGAARGLGAAWLTAQKELEDAWKEVSSQSPARRPGGNESADKE